MTLTVDIGNSRIKWALWQADKVVTRGALLYQRDNCAEAFDELFKPLEKPAHIYAACVAGEKISQALSEWCQRHWQLDVGFLKTEKQFDNIVHAYEDPSQHGVDRWAAVVAAYQKYPACALCVINAGTAVAFDLLEKDGRHLGGYIMPSYVSMYQVLQADTANVRAVLDARFDDVCVPNNTNDAVNQGLHRLLRAGVREICQFAERKMDSPMTIIISGGFAETILAYPGMPAMQHEPDLVMQGLYSIMKQREG